MRHCRTFCLIACLLGTVSLPAWSEAVSIMQKMNPYEETREALYQKYPFARYLMFTQVRDKQNNVVGIGVYPGPDAARFYELGFEEGDIIKSVNGVAATGRDGRRELIRSFQGEAEVDTVELRLKGRSGQQKQLNLSDTRIQQLQNAP